MRKFVAVAAAVTGCIVVIAACGNKDSTPNAAAPTATAPGQYPPGQYPPQPYGQPGQPGQYPPPGPAPAPGPYPPAPGPGPAPAPAATMATPSPIATPCQNDGPCLTHHCNMQYQKCAFPCVNSEVDC